MNKSDVQLLIECVQRHPEMAPVPDMFLDEELARDLDTYHTKHNLPTPMNNPNECNNMLPHHETSPVINPTSNNGEEEFDL